VFFVTHVLILHPKDSVDPIIIGNFRGGSGIRIPVCHESQKINTAGTKKAVAEKIKNAEPSCSETIKSAAQAPWSTIIFCAIITIVICFIKVLSTERCVDCDTRIIVGINHV